MVFDVMDGSSEQGWLARVRRLETLSDVLGGYRRSLDAGAARPARWSPRGRCARRSSRGGCTRASGRSSAPCPRRWKRPGCATRRCGRGWRRGAARVRGLRELRRLARGDVSPPGASLRRRRARALRARGPALPRNGHRSRRDLRLGLAREWPRSASRCARSRRRIAPGKSVAEVLELLEHGSRALRPEHRRLPRADARAPARGARAAVRHALRRPRAGAHARREARSAGRSAGRVLRRPVRRLHPRRLRLVLARRRPQPSRSSTRSPPPTTRASRAITCRSASRSRSPTGSAGCTASPTATAATPRDGRCTPSS